MAMKLAVNDVKNLSGPEKAAIVLLALGEDHTRIWEALDDEEIKEVSQAMAGLGTVSASVVEDRSAGRVRVGHELDRRDHGLLRADPAPAGLVHAAGQGRRPHGRDPRSRGSHHVGQAGQRERGRARQLSEERVPPDRRRRAVEGEERPRRPRAGLPAGRLRPGMRHPHAADGAGAARDPRQDRDDPAHRIHVEPGAHVQARQPRDDGRDRSSTTSTARPKPASSPPWKNATAKPPSASAP